MHYAENFGIDTQLSTGETQSNIIRGEHLAGYLDRKWFSGESFYDRQDALYSATEKGDNGG